MVAPVGVTVQLDIVSLDVAHSWWIPKLGGKFDAIPGYVNHTWFRLERPGVYTRPVRRAVRAQPRRHGRPGPRRRTGRVRAWVARQKRLIDAANATAAREHRATAPGGALNGDRPTATSTAPGAAAPAQIVADRVEPAAGRGWVAG